MIDFQKELNPQQLDVVLNADGPCLVLAGAGSGKTRTITYRVAYLLEKGVNPENILLLTFTNKAANEMIERVGKLITDSSIEVGFKSAPTRILSYAGTFHSLANKFLRRYANAIGYQSNFTILDEDDSQTLLKLSLKKFKPDSEKKFASARVVKSIISYARNAQTTLVDALDLKYPQWIKYAEIFDNIAADYEARKKQSGAMDFDDLLVNWLLILNQPEIQKKLSEQFKYILVDEYQDTNRLQALIVYKLSLAHGNVLVVGDDAQSIYSFRAADIKNILDFEKKYPQARMFKLEINYRSSSEILQLANEVIANNLKQYKKELKTLVSSGIKPTLQPQMDQKEEACFIVGRIKEKLASGLPHREIAVLFRAAFHSQMLEMELVKAGLTYDFRGGLRFFDRAHIKDVLAYLRIINNLSDAPAWLRVLTHEEGIGEMAAQKIIDAIRGLDNIEGIGKIGYQILPERARQGWHNFARIWDSLVAIGKKDVSALIMSIKESSYSDYLEAEHIDARERLQDIEQLAVFAESADSLDSFLAEATLQESIDLRGSTHLDTDTRIILSTIHQAKGLEWDSVFIINLASGAFPSDYAFKERDGLEEERRLFYVAITRAKKNLYLTYPMSGGGWGNSDGSPSMFLEEISSRLLDDRSLLIRPSLVLDDEAVDVRYVSEDDSKPFRINPGSFLRDINDL